MTQPETVPRGIRLTIWAALVVLVVAVVLVWASLVLSRQFTERPPAHVQAAAQCHEDGGVSMWGRFGTRFVRCDHADGRSVNAAFYFTADPQ